MTDPDTTHKNPDNAWLVERSATGVSGLDTLLGGGFVHGAIYLVMGRPGTGKTTLGNQLCFEHVKRGGRAAYMTLLAESHAAMLKNLHTMAFFDQSVINNGLSYVGAYRSLRDDKLRACSTWCAASSWTKRLRCSSSTRSRRLGPWRRTTSR